MANLSKAQNFLELSDKNYSETPGTLRPDRACFSTV